MERGTVVLVDLDPVVGHEQRGLRPCVVVSDPTVDAGLRFPVIAVVPVTRTAGVGGLYLSLSAGQSGLRQRSFALTDQVRSIDKRRVRRSWGRISRGELCAIDRGLRLFLGLGELAPPA